ncbi:hypothetical protein MRX96_018875 [Rhipicephalus microplus]
MPLGSGGGGQPPSGVGGGGDCYGAPPTSSGGGPGAPHAEWRLLVGRAAGGAQPEELAAGLPGEPDQPVSEEEPAPLRHWHLAAGGRVLLPGEDVHTGCRRPPPQVPAPGRQGQAVPV